MVNQDGEDDYFRHLTVTKLSFQYLTDECFNVLGHLKFTD